MSLVVSNHNVTADDAGIPLRRVPIKKPLDAIHDVCRDFILREMTDAIEFEEARVRELALPAGEMGRADESIRKAPDDERGDVAQCAESCADGVECRIAGHEAPRERPRPFARPAVREQRREMAMTGLGSAACVFPTTISPSCAPRNSRIDTESA
jgi:hypothetical protein